MAEAVRRPHYSFREYVQLEVMANVRHEFLGGDIFAMAGGTPEHAALAGNLIAMLHERLRFKSCRVHSSDLRIRVPETGLTTYPDVTVLCGRPEQDPEDGSTILNPTLVAEVTSPSSAAYDRGDKLAHYQRIASLQEVIVVAHDRVLVERFARTGATWLRTAASSGELVILTSLEIEIAVDDLYRDHLEPTGSLVRLS